MFYMRWEAQTLQVDHEQLDIADGDPPSGGVQHPMVDLELSSPTPEFAHTEFHEVITKSALNKVPEASNMPFRWSINPYRGCPHACVYCYARGTHEYLDFNYGEDFDRQIVVKVNIVDALRQELKRGKWDGQTVALGTNTDPYQRAEGRYQLMPGLLAELGKAGAPVSLLTKGTLLSRDIPLLRSLAPEIPLDIGVSLAMIDPQLTEIFEPGTPSPSARLKLIEKLSSAGANVSIMAMPIIPWLTDSINAMEQLFSSVASAGATSIQTTPLFLRPGSREWFMSFIQSQYPHLLAGFQSMYSGRIYAPARYANKLRAKTRQLAHQHGLGIGAVHESEKDPDVHFRTHLPIRPVNSRPTTTQTPGTNQQALF